MDFNKINIDTWKRREYFEHYFINLPCTYSMTTNIDITKLLKNVKLRHIKLYPTMIYILSTLVNNHEEFRTAIDSEGNVGVFDTMNPEYTIFHKDDETFSSLWTGYNSDFSKFYEGYLVDLEQYQHVKGISPKPNIVKNTFPISSIPWTSFNGFNLNLDKGASYLLPIFTMGKYFEQENKILLPLAIQVHHAVCDGFHLGRFINEIQEMADDFLKEE